MERIDMNPENQVDLIGPERIPIDPELLTAARTGDRSLLERLILRFVARPEVANGVLLGVTVGGNTALHIAATHGHLEFAQMICQRERSLVVARNVMLETSLHCAARAGHDQIISSIISFTSDDEDNGVGVKTVLRARNRYGGTALHEAARNGHVRAAEELMLADRELANMVDERGISPLYLAAMAGSLALVRTILESSFITTTAASSFPVFYAGPNGQTALHAAALLQNTEIAENLLEQNEMLAKNADKSGSTPLHYAASAGNDEIVKLLLEHDTSLAYIADSTGLFPVHVAATMDEVNIINTLIKYCPDSDELLDNEGRNFFHTAVEGTNIAIVQYICKRSELVKLMNTRDYEGNTPLHLAVKSGHRCTSTILMRNKRVHSSIMNNEGLTPLDLATIGDEYGLFYYMNPSHWIRWCLAQTGALASPRRADHFIRDNIISSDLEKESEKQMKMNQSLVIVSVLIATVTFAAAFTMPGGRGVNGTPTPVARRYTFKAFVVADTIAFIFSVLSTCWITFGGSILSHPRLRTHSIFWSYRWLVIATRSMVAAFALGVYLVLSPVSNSMGIVVSVIASTTLLFDTPEKLPLYSLASTIKSRVGWTGMLKSRVLPHSWSWAASERKANLPRFIVVKILRASSIFILIFLLALL